MNRIKILQSPDLIWSFDGSDPYFSCVMDGERTYPHTVKVDPFPCYAHSEKLVAETAEAVEKSFPVGFPPTYFLLDHESIGRTNGYADKNNIWDGEATDPYPFDPFIVLIGKRIPLHPAMTRYLVAHEYGHIVQWWIEHKRGVKSASTTDMDREYMALRQGTNNDYGARRWHTNVGELIANDFRICVSGIETEFWPHEGFEHPLAVPAVVEYWQEMVEKHSVK